MPGSARQAEPTWEVGKPRRRTLEIRRRRGATRTAAAARRTGQPPPGRARYAATPPVDVVQSSQGQLHLIGIHRFKLRARLRRQLA